MDKTKNIPFTLKNKLKGTGKMKTQINFVLVIKYQIWGNSFDFKYSCFIISI